jgi:hypothetical protein
MASRCLLTGSWVSVDGEGNFWLDLTQDPAFDLVPGHTVWVFDEAGALATKDTVVNPLTLDEPVTIGGSTLTGTGDPVIGEVRASIHNESGEDVAATFAGFDWTASFTQPLTLGMNGSVYQVEQGLDDGDRTEIWWGTPNPMFTVYPEGDNLWGNGWTPGTTVTVTIGDPANPFVEEQVTVNSDEFFGMTTSGVYDIQPGDYIEVTDGSMAKGHTVTHLAVDVVDTDADTVTGTAYPNARVHTWIDGADVYLETEADEFGNWIFDYSSDFDIVVGTGLVFVEIDNDDDRTLVYTVVPDTTAPVVSVVSPSDWSSVPGPVTVEGPVSDDVGVAGVQVRVYDRDSGWHWDGAAFVDGPATDLVGVVDVVGSTSTDWSYVFDLGAVPPSIQAYNVSVRAFDAAGNYSDWERVNFYVTDVVPDTTPPVVSVVSPSDWSSVPGPVTVEGPVSDDVGVAGVQVRVYDRDSGWHWDGAAFVDGPATDLVGVVDVVGSTSTDWSYVFDLGAVPPSIQAYNVSVRAFDAAGNYSDWERVNFYVTDVVPDTTLPVVSVVSPSDWSSVPGPVTVEGPVSDDVGVAGVQVRVYDRDSGWHWDGAAFVDGPATDLVGVVDVVGSTSTDWSYVFDLGAVPPSIQAYNVSVRAFDAAGNYSDWERVNFYVTDVVPDTTLPVVSVVSPSDWSSVPGPVTVEGPVSDDVGVAGVQVRVYDRDSGWHWDGAAFVDGPATDLVGVVDVVGSTSTDWSYVFDLGAVPPSIQAYNVSVRAFDAAGNYSDWERVNFYVTDVVPDTTLPVVSVVSPSDWSSVPGPVTVEGPVSDDVGVAGVQVRVYDRDSGWHWDGAAFVDGPATDLVGVVDVVGSTSTDWSYVFDLGAVPPSIQAYNVSVRAFDAAGNYSDWERVNFYVTEPVNPR